MAEKHVGSASKGKLDTVILWAVSGVQAPLVICGDGLWSAVVDLLVKDDQVVHKVYSAGVFDLLWSHRWQRTVSFHSLILVTDR